MPTTNDFATSIELRYLVDRALAARQAGRRDVADIFGRAAQGLLEVSMPDLAHDVSRIASRKGEGCAVASKLALRVTPTAAAAVMIAWTLRGARQRAIQTLCDAFRHEPEFDQTVKLLCRRVLEPTPVPAPPSSPPKLASIEVGAPQLR